MVNAHHDGRRLKYRWWLCCWLLTVVWIKGPAMADDEQISLPGDNWQLVTDGVMGGVSQGTLTSASYQGKPCVRLRGVVSTANNGGFIQMAQSIPPADAATLDTYAGIRIVVSGNGQSYNLHLRTTDLTLPWQSYRATVVATERWQTIDLPFSEFIPYKTASQLAPTRLSRVGVVAIGRAFDADVCVADVGFYRAPG